MDKGKFGTGEGLLWYGICARCERQASVVRDAFSEALGVKNRLLRYGRDIRYRKRTPMVRGCIFRAPYRRGHLPFWHLLYSVQAMLFFFWQFEKFGTGEGLLWYGICARCKKQASVVRDAFSEAFGVKNRLLRYGRDIRYRKPPPTVRGTSSFGGTRYRKPPPTVRGVSSDRRTFLI